MAPCKGHQQLLANAVSHESEFRPVTNPIVYQGHYAGRSGHLTRSQINRTNYRNRFIGPPTAGERRLAAVSNNPKSPSWTSSIKLKLISDYLATNLLGECTRVEYINQLTPDKAGRVEAGSPFRRHLPYFGDTSPPGDGIVSALIQILLVELKSWLGHQDGGVG